MWRARKLLALPAADRWLLAQAALLVVAVRLGLWLLPFRIVRRLVSGITDGGMALQQCNPMTVGANRHIRPQRMSLWRIAGRGVRATPERIAWAVNVVSQYVPAAACLTSALAAEALLAWHGYPAQLRIGVAKGAAGRLEAHAWLEHEGQILIGGAIRDRYQALPNL